MRCLIALTLVSVAAAQFGGGGFGGGGGGGGGGGNFGDLFQQIRDRLDATNVYDDTIDTIHGWRLEDHQTSDYHLLLFINDSPDGRYCYVVRADSSWEGLLNDQDNLYRITEEIYALINDPNHRERPLRPGDLAQDYSDFDAARECRGHDTYSIRYTPSFATSAPAATGSN